MARDVHDSDARKLRSVTAPAARIPPRVFNQGDIDAVLNDAQAAVDSLARETGGMADDPTAQDLLPRSPAPIHQPTPTTRNIQRILKLRVPVVVRIAERTLRTADIMKLAPGSIVEFDRRVDEELDLMVNNQKVGTGMAVKIGEHFGLRVGFIGDARQRLASLRNP